MMDGYVQQNVAHLAFYPQNGVLQCNQMQTTYFLTKHTNLRGPLLQFDQYQHRLFMKNMLSAEEATIAQV